MGSGLGILHERGSQAKPNHPVVVELQARRIGSPHRDRRHHNGKARDSHRISDTRPDGKSIAWTKNFPEGHSEIMIRDRESGTDRQLTHDRKFADDPLWSRTGHIFYSSNKGGNINLWIIPASGGEPVQVTRGSGPDSPLGMTADGKKLMYSEVQDIGQVKIASLGDGSVRQLTVDDRERGMAGDFTKREICRISCARS